MSAPRRQRFHWQPICILVLLSAGVALTGCMATWTRITLPEISGPSKRYTLAAPAGWVHAAFIQQGVCISKDGPDLNWIEVRHAGKKSAFKAIGVEITDTQLVTEVAEYCLAHFKETHTAGTVRMIDLAPARISGRDGFRMHLSTTDGRGLIDDYLIYGVTDNDFFYRLLYRAPRLYYFEHDLATFEALVTSFKINPKP